MSKLKRTRSEAYAVAELALNLAQNMSWEAQLESPDRLRLSAKWSRKKLYAVLVEKHAVVEARTQAAYELYNAVAVWADEYPLESNKEGKK